MGSCNNTSRANCSGDVAQLGERCLRKAEAEGSNPFISTMILQRLNHGALFFYRRVACPLVSDVKACTRDGPRGRRAWPKANSAGCEERRRGGRAALFERPKGASSPPCRAGATNAHPANERRATRPAPEVRPRFTRMRNEDRPRFTCVRRGVRGGVHPFPPQVLRALLQNLWRD